MTMKQNLACIAMAVVVGYARHKERNCSCESTDKPELSSLAQKDCLTYLPYYSSGISRVS